MNEKWWSILFGVVMFACGALFAVAPMLGWWLPPAVSSHAWDIDYLYYLILAITGFFFVLTEALLVVFMYRYGAGTPQETRKPSVFWTIFKPLASVLNTAKKIEMAWTFVPAVILLYLAFAQVSTWADVKYKSRLDSQFKAEMTKVGDIPVYVGVSARQFEWRIRYPKPATWRLWKEKPELAKAWINRTTPEFDDLIDVPNELHVIKDRYALVHLTTRDVLHSFNLPHMRIKQDALPGKTLPVWFKPIKSNVIRVDGQWVDGGGRDLQTGKPQDPNLVWELACAELCGWGHYRMVGRLYVHDTEADFLAWLEWADANRNNFGAAESKQ